MTPIVKIDVALGLMFNDDTLKPATDMQIFGALLDKHPELSDVSMQGFELTTILDKLCEDKHIKYVEKEIQSDPYVAYFTKVKFYSITFWGGLFYQQGGYTADIERKQKENARIVALENSAKINRA